MKKQPNMLVETLAILCIILGSIALSVFSISSWAHSLIFNTNDYLDVVTPLPKDQAVSQAISTYTIDTFFEKRNVEEKINAALPDQAKFLTPTLADSLQNRSYKLTTTIIQSDQFTSVWVAANTFFHKRILNIIRSGGILSQLSEKEFLQGTSIQFDGSDLAQAIKNRLGSDSQLFSDTQIQQFKSITIPTYTKLQNIRQTVYWISELSSMLLYAAIALILSGIAIAFSRQKAVLISGFIVAITMIITLLTLQIIKTDFLNQITQSVYNSAAGVVWDSFLSGLKQKLWLTTLGGVILIGIAMLGGPYAWAKNFRKSLGILQLQKSGFMQGITGIRMLIAKYSLWLRLLGVVIAIIALLLIEAITISTVVITLSLLLIYLALLSLIFPR